MRVETQTIRHSRLLLAALFIAAIAVGGSHLLRTGHAPATSAPNPGTTCPLPAYPTPACTGVPPGTVFTKTVDGDYTASIDGEVIDSWHITGTLIIRAKDVTIRNTLIDTRVTNDENGVDERTWDFTITDSTIGPDIDCDPATYQYCDTTTRKVCDQGGITATSGIALQSHNYVATRVHIRGWDHAYVLARPNGSVVIRDSYTHTCSLGPAAVGGDGTHADAFQAYCPTTPPYGPCGEAILDHNTFDNRTEYHTTAIFSGTGGGNGYTTGFTLTDNLLLGGNYTINLGWCNTVEVPGCAANRSLDDRPDFVVSGNKVVNNTWDYAPATTENTCARQQWKDNHIVTVDENYNVTSSIRPLGCMS